MTICDVVWDPHWLGTQLSAVPMEEMPLFVAC